VYVGSDDDFLYAVRASDGTVAWRAATSPGRDVDSSPAIDGNGNVYFGADDNRVHCVDASGNELWTFFTGGDVNSSPAIDVDGTVFVGSDDGFIYALRPEPGLSPSNRLLWKYAMGGSVRSSPAIDSTGALLVGSDGDRVVKFRGAQQMFALSSGLDLVAQDAAERPVDIHCGVSVARAPARASHLWLAVVAAALAAGARRHHSQRRSRKQPAPPRAARSLSR
jgi:outer membrane protein assembly factor BamB